MPQAGFWRRLLAFWLDGLLLAIAGVLVGIAAYDELARMGGYGPLVGFAIALLYFGILNSGIGGGRTLGKRLLGIRVAGVDGKPLSLSRSLLRYCVLFIPFFLNGATVPPQWLVLPLACVPSLLVVGGMAAIVYLFVFNLPTRRSLHDFAAGSWVVRAQARDPVAPRGLRRAHGVVLVLLALLSLALPFAVARFAQLPVFDGLLPSYAAISAMDGVSAVQVSRTITAGGGRRAAALEASLQIRAPELRTDALAREVARTLVDNVPDARDMSITVSLVYGYDIGIMASRNTNVYNFRPGDFDQERR
jgi:uncharacterized RDD family membrane protein YckC